MTPLDHQKLEDTIVPPSVVTTSVLTMLLYGLAGYGLLKALSNEGKRRRGR
jgi:hypothetical protein